MTEVDLPARVENAPDYLRIRDAVRSDYYRNEVAQSHHIGASLSGAVKFPNIHVYHPTEIEKRP